MNEKIKKLTELIKANQTIVAIGGFCVLAIGLLLISVFALQEFVVSVCILMVIEVAMAALLHNVELWKHGVLLVAQIIVALILKNIPLVLVCIVIYIAATIALSLLQKTKN